MIKLVPYDPAWPAMFVQEAGEIQAAFGHLALRVEHVGSTAVPWLMAKPVIDIQVSVASLAPAATYRRLLASIGYSHIPLGEFDRVYPFFQKPTDWPCSHHIHLCEIGGEQETKHLVFRDQLRAHRELAGQYVQLKQWLATQHHGETQESRGDYTLGKSSFVEAVLEKAMPPGRLSP